MLAAKNALSIDSKGAQEGKINYGHADLGN